MITSTVKLNVSDHNSGARYTTSYNIPSQQLVSFEQFCMVLLREIKFRLIKC